MALFAIIWVRGVVHSVKITDPRTEPCEAQCEITTGPERNILNINAFPAIAHVRCPHV